MGFLVVLLVRGNAVMGASMALNEQSDQPTFAFTVKGVANSKNIEIRIKFPFITPLFVCSQIKLFYRIRISDAIIVNLKSFYIKEKSVKFLKII
ncbi:hypothetical protein C2G38_1103784 [Gigaspora rosea]|uniref:Uncharacterized protein n=1 Tax=Gigaspora rosea TaxID=44941 RepID=A0A397VG21_9GLOM|nr:hypothetical protein C2G38_1103784 [Gigaspora rosea]